MKITKRQLKRIIKEEKSRILREESSAAVEKVISSIEPSMEDMSKPELELLSRQLDDLIMKLGGSVNESTRTALRRIKRLIKEGKQKILGESVVDETDFEDNIQRATTIVADLFYEKMMQLWDDDPDAQIEWLESQDMVGVNRMVWEEAVTYATQEIDSAVGNAIADAVQVVEDGIVDGRYVEAALR